MMEPGFKRFDEKQLSAYIMENLINDLRLDPTNSDIHDSYKSFVSLEYFFTDSYKYLTSLEVT